ncbi:mitochondrial carrier [Coniophora puteana RWD-64-598 SS2]|uniref:Mitochondrial carrier n=1 Tax=Coniophora puteana (strain RWD-64-598) TaxID=741705 RepID=A0A5M3MLC9_CONPW|nr:mitochondrial carrier [Coniophora puteana RWD-64-598 SS2]EIW80042.1 mitochondrial carrier [Coniophora puteana RWD-64-598 SS2]
MLKLLLTLVLSPILFIATFLVFVPLRSTLVRVRAYYDPKRVELESEKDALPPTQRVNLSYFGMLKRTYKIEGVSGLYKGLSNIAFSVVTVIVGGAAGFLIFDRCRNGNGLDDSCGKAVGRPLIRMLSLLIQVPEVIIVHRAMTTPIKLPYFAAFHSLRTLLAPTERQRPWKLFLVPGLLCALALTTTYSALVPRTLRTSLISFGDNTILPNQTSARILAYAVVSALTTMVMTPVEVIIVRLSVQRPTEVSREYTAVAQEAGDHGEVVVPYREEDVIELRADRKPYMGLFDCAKYIIAEEGWSTLYRGWWITMLFSIL